MHLRDLKINVVGNSEPELNRESTVQECDARMLKKEPMLVTQKRNRKNKRTCY